MNRQFKKTIIVALLSGSTHLEGIAFDPHHFEGHAIDCDNYVAYGFGDSNSDGSGLRQYALSPTLATLIK